MFADFYKRCFRWSDNDPRKCLESVLGEIDRLVEKEADRSSQERIGANLTAQTIAAPATTEDRGVCLTLKNRIQ